MDIRGWDERYRSRARPSEDFGAAPTPLLIDTAKQLKLGKALDLACGTGRNALWLAQQGWSVTAIDAASAAIDTLRICASKLGVNVDARQADLERGEYVIEQSAWDLISICYYLQRDLFQPAKLGVVPGGVLLAIVHITEPGEQPTDTRAKPGELKTYFNDWEILHYYEGKPNDTAHQRSVAEIVVHRPQTGPLAFNRLDAGLRRFAFFTYQISSRMCQTARGDYMIDLKLNELPVDAAGDFDDVPEESLTEEQRAERRRRANAGLSINQTVARDANLSVGSRGTDTSGVESGAGAGAGLTHETPATPGESPAPNVVEGPRGSGTTPRGDSDFK